jgi:hypothetical protein
MVELASDLKRGENRARAITTAALGATFLVAALAPQNTRAVFIIDGGLPKAFTATLADSGAGRSASYLSGLAGPRNLGLRRAEVPGLAFPRGARPGGAVPAGATPAGTTPDVGTGNAVTPLPRQELASVDTANPGQTGAGQPFSPFIAQPTGAASGLAATTPGTGTPGTGTPGTGTPGTGTPGTGTPGTGTPGTGTETPDNVSAVPEPSTWAMLLSGFLLIGVALRRGRRRATAAA